MKHTPGPWTTVECEYGWHIGPQPAGVCSIANNTGGGASDAEQLANARLIAAAPDMIAALTELDKLMAFDTEFGRCDCWPNPEGLNAAAKQARAAIAKATGEPPQ